MKRFSIGASARSYPSLPYEHIKDTILGKQYKLSLVFVGADRARQLNQTYRQKSYGPNVLSFPLTKHSGEIYITPTIAKRECKKFNLTYTGYVGYLFIHGLLHLRGLRHGAKMEQLEQEYVSKYKLT